MAFRRTFRVLTLLCVSFLILTGIFARSAEALTAEEERKLGKKVLLDIERKSEIVDDLILQGFIERVGRSLVPYASPAPFDFQFFRHQRSITECLCGSRGVRFCHHGPARSSRK